MVSSFVVLDSVTGLLPEHRGSVACCASHGGTYAAYHAATMGVSALILNDAGVGREQAGLQGVLLLADLGVPAATVSHRTARIGEGLHGAERGVISFVNAPAAELGLRAGMPCREALRLLDRVRLPAAPPPAAVRESRFELPGGRNGVRLIGVDSISLLAPEDAGHIVVTASHGGLLGGRPQTAVPAEVYAVVCNDADRGIDDAGISRLPALDEAGIAGACVSAFSARIGDARSTFHDGFVSVINETARRRGGSVGQSCRVFAETMIEARTRGL